MMSPEYILITLLLLSTGAYYIGRKRALSVAGGSVSTDTLHSRPTYYGALTALWCAIPAIAVFGFWMGFESKIINHLVISEMPPEIRHLPEDRLNLVVNDIKNLIEGNIVSGVLDPAMHNAAENYKRLKSISSTALGIVVLMLGILSIALVQRMISPTLRARNHVETITKYLFIFCSTLAIFTTIGILLSVLYESIRFFKIIPITDFLFGLEWSPQMAIREDQVGSSGAFGAIPVFAGTAMISLIAMAVAVPIGLMSAIYLSEYAAEKVRAVVKPLMEILAGIPTVVYGFFAALTVAPVIRSFGEMIGLDVSSESALTAGLVMGIMIIPFISSLSDDVINAVPRTLREGSYGLGATRSETIKQVILPAALPGIVGSILLAVSRAIGETMIVVMAAGLAANLTANPLATMTTVTVQIVTLLIGDQEFDSPKTLAAFALGLVLFMVTLCLNVISLYIVRKYREQYE
jgi:phosphate transport system permease protein